MKKLRQIAIAVTVTVMASLAANAQSVMLRYQYDAAGNRVGREVVSPEQNGRSSRAMPHDDITVSPTVTSDVVTISTTLDPEQNAMRYSVSRLDGSVLASGDITMRQTHVSFSGYVSSIYLLTIEREENTKCFKIIKR